MESQRHYVAEQLAVIVGTSVTPDDEMTARWWSQLTREEERNVPRDEHGNYPYEASRLQALGLLEDPPLHEDLTRLPTSEVPRWPGGARFAACLSHDVDRIVSCPWRERLRQAMRLRHLTPGQRARLHLAAGRFLLGALVGQSDPAPFDQYLEMESRHGFHSTFFVLPEQAREVSFFDNLYRYADPVFFRGTRVSFLEAVRVVQALGWEIGLHGSYHSGGDADELRRQKAQVEALVARPVTSVRQHFLRFDAHVTPAHLAAAGFSVDSTLGYAKTIGCRAGMAFPYVWPDTELLEVPLTMQDVGLLFFSEIKNDLPIALARARALIRRIADAGGVVSLSWHIHPMSPGAYVCYAQLLEYVAELGGWGCTVGQLDAWWRMRREAVHRGGAQPARVRLVDRRMGKDAA